jgi:hypothetical protein
MSAILIAPDGYYTPNVHSFKQKGEKGGHYGDFRVTQRGGICDPGRRFPSNQLQISDSYGLLRWESTLSTNFGPVVGRPGLRLDHNIDISCSIQDIA